MRTTSSLRLALALLISSASALGAQSEPVLPGDRVRVWARGLSPQPLLGTVAALDPDTIRIRRGYSEPVRTVPRATLTRLQIQQGHRSNVLLGMGLGALTGTVVGAGVGLALYETCTPGIFFDCADRSDWALLFGGLGGFGGAAVGAYVGSKWISERWVDVPTARLHVHPNPLDGRGVAVSLSFAL